MSRLTAGEVPVSRFPGRERGVTYWLRARRIGRYSKMERLQTYRLSVPKVRNYRGVRETCNYTVFFATKACKLIRKNPPQFHQILHRPGTPGPLASVAESLAREDPLK